MPEPFFSGGSAESTAAYSAGNPGPGAEIGPYKLLSILGEGGYGIVYLAQQDRPIRRKVALKVIKPGMDSRQVIARFEAEHQALAMLDHPNIARVFTAGTTDIGRLYFAMEYIDGQPITAYCDEHKLSIRDRLTLFRQVCNAIQYAHQKGIIHRDLKPANIMVADNGGETGVRIIDFGIAKALTQSLTEKTVRTEEGRFVGTLEYMSPEQADLDTRAVDTRSDVYALGVVLYELLTGLLPFDPEELRDHGINHARTILRTREPRTPSTRLTELGTTLRQIADRRRIAPRDLRRSLRRELEWIPLKAMRKEPGRRYQSVADLAADIERYQRGVPLTAGPESSLYRISKFVNRHRTMVGATFAIVILIVLSLVIMSLLYVRAERLRIVAGESKVVAEQERRRAVEAGEHARHRLVDLHEEQGRTYLQMNEPDHALILLREALREAPDRISAYLLMLEGMDRHPDPNLQMTGHRLAWHDYTVTDPLLFTISPDRRFAGFLNRDTDVISVFDTETAELHMQVNANGAAAMMIAPGSTHMIVRIREDERRHKLLIFDMQSMQQIGCIHRSNLNSQRLSSLLLASQFSPTLVSEQYSRIVLDGAGEWFAFLDCNDGPPVAKSWVSVWSFTENTLRRSQRYGPDRWLSGLIYRHPSTYGFAAVLVAIDAQSFCHLWNMPQLERVDVFPFDAVHAVFSQVRLIYMKANGELVLMDRSGNRTVRRFPNISRYGLSCNDSRLLTETTSTGSADQGTERVSVDLWNTEDGRHISQLTIAPLRNWHSSPDGRYLVTESRTKEIRIWHTDGAQPIFSIPSEQGQEVVDICPDSRWLVTGGVEENQLVYVWRLRDGQCFRPYALEITGTDVGRGWAEEEPDRVFAQSWEVPPGLPRFNATGSALIHSSGIISFRPNQTQLQTADQLVAAFVPLRLSAGRIRSASPEEMQLAKLHLYTASHEDTTVEAARCLLDLASSAMEQDNVAKAAAYMNRYLSLPAVDDAGLAANERLLRDKVSTALFKLAQQEERQGQYVTALFYYQETLRFQGGHSEALSRSAWLLATCLQRCDHRSGEAVTYAKRACELSDWRNPEYVSVYAVACAANGEYDRARRLQKEAIQLLPSSDYGRWMGNFEERLRLFLLEQPYDSRFFWNLPSRPLMSWWHFDGPEEGIAMDGSGRHHHLHLTGSALKTTGKLGKALRCISGTEARCDDVPDNSLREAMTVVAWVKLGDTNDVAWKDLPIVSRGYGWALLVDRESHTLRFDGVGLDVPQSRPFSHACGMMPLDNDSWHQVAAVYDGEQLAVYVNGRPDGYVETHGQMLVDAGPVYVGKRKRNVTAEWRGCIDDVRIYDRALRPEDIAELWRYTR